MKKIIRIIQDEDSENPRESFDQVGTFLFKHKNYELGDKNFSSGSNLLDEIEKIKEEAGGEDKLFIYPVFMMDHSGLTLSMSDFMFKAFDQQGWDWGTVGFIYITKEKAESECPKDEDLEKWVVKILESEIEQLNQWLNNDVWGWILEETTTCPECKHEHTEQLESVWGYYGKDFCIEMAKEDHPHIPIEGEE